MSCAPLGSFGAILCYRAPSPDTGESQDRPCGDAGPGGARSPSALAFRSKRHQDGREPGTTRAGRQYIQGGGQGHVRKLKKIGVTTGVYWVEAPEAEVFMLCGCPEDAVKHLMLRGLILPTERDGVTFDTGPNAILLSDVMLQNGSFSNQAEFPVLQILYLQGMLLPDHPNNTGAKPLLVGSADQLKAQKEYIYRGNYGLVSAEEIMETGATREEAEEMMRLKLAFAFGRIRSTDELLDSIEVGSKPTEIRNGVTIRRQALNVFEIAYGDETVTVDLNLNHTESYRSPYPLGFQNIKREYFAVVHSGQGDGWDINRPAMSSILMYQGKIYLIDAGPNISYSLMALGIGVNEIEGVFHTPWPRRSFLRADDADPQRSPNQILRDAAGAGLGVQKAVGAAVGG